MSDNIFEEALGNYESSMSLLEDLRFNKYNNYKSKLQLFFNDLLTAIKTKLFIGINKIKLPQPVFSCETEYLLHIIFTNYKLTELSTELTNIYTPFVIELVYCTNNTNIIYANVTIEANLVDVPDNDYKILYDKINATYN